MTNRKSKGKAKATSCNVICASSRKAETDVPSLTDSEEETIVLATELLAQRLSTLVLMMTNSCSYVY